MFLEGVRRQSFWKFNENAPSHTTPKADKRMPGAKLKRQVIERDGFHCRFCQVPVIDKKVRVALNTLYPKEARWGAKNAEQHTGLVATWLQFDHVIPYSMGGTNTLDNIIITCAPCNYGKMGYTLEELYLEDPRDKPILKSTWDGLERLLTA